MVGNARPLLSAPAFDGMELEPALRRVWGSVPSDALLVKLKGEASTRSYYRVRSSSRSPQSIVVMRLPADAPMSSSPSPSAANIGELPFLNVHRHLAALGVPVPHVYVEDVARGVLLLEDLGDESFELRLAARSRAEWPALYGAAVDLMAALHERASAPDPACIAYGRSFDRTLLRWELEHFRKWGLEALDVALSSEERRALDALSDDIVARMLALPQGFVHRDFQSRNLMWAPRSAQGELVLIDFQDALLGPAVYDLVALMCDSYVDLDEPLQRAMITRLAQRRGFDGGALEQAFWLVAVQRKLKDAARFVFIDQVRGDASFLPGFGRSIGYVGRALKHLPELSALEALLTRAYPGFPDAVATPAARTGSRPGALP